MRPIEQTIRDQLTIRPRVLGFSLFALIGLLMTPVFGDAGEQEMVRHSILSDDISNQVNQIPGSDTAGGGTGGNGTGGNDNNGHGNNQDGVDSSNPGQGNGGPNGGQDDSCSGGGDCVDDEGGNGNGH